MKSDLDMAAGYVSWRNINMLIEAYQQVAERSEMSRQNLKNSLTKILDCLKAAEESLGIKLGPRSPAQRKHENFSNNFLISYLEYEDTEARTSLLQSAKLRRFLG